MKKHIWRHKNDIFDDFTLCFTLCCCWRWLARSLAPSFCSRCRALPIHADCWFSFSSSQLNLSSIIFSKDKWRASQTTQNSKHGHANSYITANKKWKKLKQKQFVNKICCRWIIQNNNFKTARITRSQTTSQANWSGERARFGFCWSRGKRREPYKMAHKIVQWLWMGNPIIELSRTKTAECLTIGDQNWDAKYLEYGA